MCCGPHSRGGCALDRTVEVGVLWTAQYRLTYLLVFLSTVARDRLVLKSITGFIPPSVSKMTKLNFLVNINFDRTELLTEL